MGKDEMRRKFHDPVCNISTTQLLLNESIIFLKK